MFGIVGYGSFLVSSVLLNITPGSDTIYILSRSVVGGRRKGIASALGISTGILVHTLLAAFGLSAVLSTSALAFNIMKILGAAYLVFMGLKAVFTKSTTLCGGSENKGETALKAYIQGILTNALNPKVALFFLALLPQFVSPDNTYGFLPFVILGLTFFCTSTIWCLILATGSSLVSKLLNKNQRVGTIANKVSGVVYIVLGLNILAQKM